MYSSGIFYIRQIMMFDWFIWYRSSHQKCSVKIAALRNLAKFTGKHLCESVFCQIFKNTYFYRTPPSDCFCLIFHFVDLQTINWFIFVRDFSCCNWNTEIVHKLLLLGVLFFCKFILFLKIVLLLFRVSISCFVGSVIIYFTFVIISSFMVNWKFVTCKMIYVFVSFWFHGIGTINSQESFPIDLWQFAGRSWSYWICSSFSELKNIFSLVCSVFIS